MAITKTDLEISGRLLDVIAPIIRAIRAIMRDFKGSDLTVPQFRVLGFVSLQPCTSKQLAEWHGVSLPAMSRMVNYLRRRKLLVRTPDPSDRRQAQLKLSPRGKMVFNRLRNAIEARLAERIAGLQEPEKQTLGVGLITLGTLFRET